MHRDSVEVRTLRVNQVYTGHEYLPRYTLRQETLQGYAFPSADRQTDD